MYIFKHGRCVYLLKGNVEKGKLSKIAKAELLYSISHKADTGAAILSNQVEIERHEVYDYVFEVGQNEKKGTPRVLCFVFLSKIAALLRHLGRYGG